MVILTFKNTHTHTHTHTFSHTHTYIHTCYMIVQQNPGESVKDYILRLEEMIHQHAQSASVTPLGGGGGGGGRGGERGRGLSSFSAAQSEGEGKGGVEVATSMYASHNRSLLIFLSLLTCFVTQTAATSAHAFATRRVLPVEERLVEMYNGLQRYITGSCIYRFRSSQMDGRKD